jgi:hypothetical protein
MTTPVLERFYQRLIKTPMNLDTRNRLGSLLAAEVRHEQSEQWQSIVSRSDSLLDSLRRLQNDGCLTLKIPYAQALAQELRALPHRGQGQRGLGGRTETEYLEHVNALTSVQKLIQDESLHALVSLYLGAPAYLHSCQAWWQYPMGSEHKASNAQQWHRDRDDLAELKLFFYATDVDASSGPHGFVPGSHTAEGLRRIFPSTSDTDPVVNGTEHGFIDDNILIQRGLKGAIKTWIGPAGSCFLEDTRGFHRAYIPTEQPRLLFSLVWTLGVGFQR